MHPAHVSMVGSDSAQRAQSSANMGTLDVLYLCNIFSHCLSKDFFLHFCSSTPFLTLKREGHQLPD